MVGRVSAVRSAAFAVLIGVVAVSGAQAQGDNGFLRGTGRTDVAFSYCYDTYREFWSGRTKTEDPTVGRITRESANLWIAYGMDAKTDLVINASYLDVESDGLAIQSNRDEKQVQDATVGFKYRMNEWHFGPGGMTLSFAPAAKIPMTHYEANAITAIGDGQIDYRFRGILQYQFEAGYWIAVESGYDYRTESPPNEVPLNVTVGVPITQYVMVTPFYSLVKSYGNKDYAAVVSQTDFPAVQEEYKRWGISAYVRVSEKLGFTAGYRDTLDGRNTGKVTSYWLGIVFKF
jgi:hypothetical protein